MYDFCGWHPVYNFLCVSVDPWITTRGEHVAPLCEHTLVNNKFALPSCIPIQTGGWRRGEVWEQANLKETRRHRDTLGYISPHRHFYCGPSTRKCFHGNTDSPTCSSTILTRDPFDFLRFFFFFFWYFDWRFLQSKKKKFNFMQENKKFCIWIFIPGMCLISRDFLNLSFYVKDFWRSLRNFIFWIFILGIVLIFSYFFINMERILISRRKIKFEDFLRNFLIFIFEIIVYYIEDIDKYFKILQDFSESKFDLDFYFYF